MTDQSSVFPGIHPQLNWSCFNNEESQIIKKLAKHWFVTYASQIKAAKSTYSYILLNPTNVITEMFNLEREVICIFSNYPKFEPRTLVIFEQIAKTLQKNRAETVCGIVISKSDDVEGKVERLCNTDPEQQITIPFTYEELKGNYSDELVNKRFRTHFHNRDLFDFLNPLKKDTYFFGRNQLVTTIISKHDSGEHSSLFGLRKSGKTSVVYALKRKIQSNGGKVLSIDCEKPAIHMLRWYTLLEQLVVKYHELKGSKVKLNLNTPYTEASCSDRFEKDILKIFNSQKNEKVLFIFDEIERISPYTASSSHWREGDDFIYFWQTLRGFFQENPSVFTYMIVGTNPKCIESPTIGHHDNPIFASIPSTYLPCFDVAQVEKMVCTLGNYMGLKFDAHITSRLTEDFGGHPFLIRQVCSILNSLISKSERPYLIDVPIYEKAKRKFYEEHIEYLIMMIQVLNDWYPDEYEMLKYLALDEEKTFKDFAENDPSLIRHLQGYGLIKTSSNGYLLNVEMISFLLKSKYKFERINLTNDEKLEEISHRRNKVEQNLRVIIKMSMKLKYGGTANEKVLACIPSARRDKLSNELNILLSKSESPLFFLDLINIIKKEWEECFKNIFTFDKEKIMLILNDINTLGRPDAHAKDISKDDFTQVRLHFNSIDKILESWL